ncbi:MAG: hypothetical protein WD850_00760 [Candidatus Spechtbacterales bacterium]
MFSTICRRAALAVFLAIIVSVAGIAPAHADHDAMVRISPLPAEGLGAGIYTGIIEQQASLEALEAALARYNTNLEHPLGQGGCGLQSVWSVRNGRIIGAILGAPVFVNREFLGHFPGGTLSAGEIVIVVCTFLPPGTGGPGQGGGTVVVPQGCDPWPEGVVPVYHALELAELERACLRLFDGPDDEDIPAGSRDALVVRSLLIGNDGSILALRSAIATYLGNLVHEMCHLREDLEIARLGTQGNWLSTPAGIDFIVRTKWHRENYFWVGDEDWAPNPVEDAANACASFYLGHFEQPYPPGFARFPVEEIEARAVWAREWRPPLRER